VKTKLACSGSFLRAIPRFVSSDGDEFLTRHFPSGFNLKDIHGLVFKKGSSWPASFEAPSLSIDLAVFTERLAGRKTYLDFSRNPRDFYFERLSPQIREWYRRRLKQRFRTVLHSRPVDRLKLINFKALQWLREKGIDIEKGDLVEIAPAAQHFMGGVKIDGKAETTVKNLFACGECAGGAHGANRPGGNSLLEGQVFGKIAGENAARSAGKTRLPKISRRCLTDFAGELRRFRVKKNSLKISELTGQIGVIMDEAASIVRWPNKLDLALERINRLKNMHISAPAKDIPSAIEAGAKLVVAEMVIRSARFRDESRGAHISFVHDKPLPRNDAKWKKFCVITKARDKMEITPRRPRGLKI